MDCKNIENQLLFYIEGELPQEEQNTIEKHLAHCSSCMGKYEFLKTSLQVIESEKKQEVKPFLYTRIQSKLEASVARQQRWVWTPVLATAVLVFGLVIGTFVGKMTMAPRISADSNYEVAYLFNDTQLESLEYKLLNDEE